jgi:branched-chain amino acid transport system permease protein
VSQFITVFLGGIGIGSVYSLVALGFSFIFKTTNSFNFAQGILVTLGSLLTYTFFMVLGLPAGLALIIVIVIAAAVGGVIERVAIYPLARRGDNDPLLWIMTTLGIASIVTGLSIRIWGSLPKGVHNYIGNPVTRFGESYVSTPFIIAFVGAILVAVALWAAQARTRWGRTMRAIADNREAVQLAGVNTLVYSLISYAVGGAIAGAAGFFVAPVTYADATGGFTFTIMGFAALALGGFLSLWGALIGGWIVGIIQSLSSTYIGLEYANFVVFLALLLVLMIKPNGLFSFGRVREI